MAHLCMRSDLGAGHALRVRKVQGSILYVKFWLISLGPCQTGAVKFWPTVGKNVRSRGPLAELAYRSQLTPSAGLPPSALPLSNLYPT